MLLKLRNCDRKRQEHSFLETAPSTRDMVTVKSGGKLLEAMVIATDGKLSLTFQIFFPDYC